MTPAHEGPSRRTVLDMAGAVTGTVLTGSAFAAASHDAGIDAVWAAWKATITRLNHHTGSVSEETSDRLCGRLIDLENRLLAFPEPSPRKATICLWLALDHCTTMIKEKDAITREDWRWIANHGEGEHGATRCVVQALRALHEGNPA